MNLIFFYFEDNSKSARGMILFLLVTCYCTPLLHNTAEKPTVMRLFTQNCFKSTMETKCLLVHLTVTLQQTKCLSADLALVVQPEEALKETKCLLAHLTVALQETELLGSFDCHTVGDKVSVSLFDCCIVGDNALRSFSQ